MTKKNADRVRPLPTLDVATLKPGTVVTVPLGVRSFSATVSEIRNGQVWVDIPVEGSPEHLTTSYPPEEIQLAG